jgi:biotin operon repressor
VIPHSAAEKMLVVLSRPGWHGWEEIAAVCGIDRETSVLAVYQQLRARGYEIDSDGGPNESRYRLQTG